MLRWRRTPLPRQTLVPPSFHSSPRRLSLRRRHRRTRERRVYLVSRSVFPSLPRCDKRERTDAMMAEEEGMPPPYFRFASTLRLVRKKRGRES